MTAFRNVVFTAALAGLLAGLVLAVLQSFTTVPLILEAERYEILGVTDHDHAHGAEAGHAHDHAWAPEDGFERGAFTLGANIVAGIGLALVLVAVSEAFGGVASWRRGVLWGLAGFAAFTLAPGLGLPPELPGMPAADLGARQAWWIFTVLATGAGIALFAFRRSTVPALAGVALIAAPHLLGAPQPVSHETAVPAELHRQFVLAVMLSSLAFWLVLGAAAGALRGRFAGPQLAARNSLG
ncbi:MAG TPA: CbtA family protein [Mesorhizobium sp.]|jgi:cobalt transporter subunit CbtA|nr:CbtA family protein [Mesorhizobium sp.]